jgi:hypothetical protein
LTACRRDEEKNEINGSKLDCYGIVSIVRKSIQQKSTVDAQTTKKECFKIALRMAIGELVQRVSWLIREHKKMRRTQMLFDLAQNAQFSKLNITSKQSQSRAWHVTWKRSTL